MKKLIVFGLILSLLTACKPSPVQEKLEAIDSVESVGISLIDYRKLVQELKIISDQHPDKKLQAKVDGHIAVLNYWECKLSTGLDFDICAGQAMAKIYLMFPELSPKLTEDVWKYNPDKAVAICWDYLKVNSEKR